MSFDGKTFDPAQDEDRLKKQLGRVFAIMRDRRWKTIGDIEEKIVLKYGYLDPPQSISARLRDLRKPKFGAHEVKRRRYKDGLFQYRLA